MHIELSASNSPTSASTLNEAINAPQKEKISALRQLYTRAGIGRNAAGIRLIAVASGGQVKPETRRQTRPRV